MLEEEKATRELNQGATREEESPKGELKKRKEDTLIAKAKRERTNTTLKIKKTTIIIEMI